MDLARTAPWYVASCIAAFDTNRFRNGKHAHRPAACVYIKYETPVNLELSKPSYFVFLPDDPPLNEKQRACFVPRGAFGRRERASARQGSTARPEYASPVLWEPTARARATGIRCRAPPVSSAPWWGSRHALIAQGGIFAPALAGSTPPLVLPGWCAAETFLPRLTSGVLLVCKGCGREGQRSLCLRIVPDMFCVCLGMAATSAGWVARDAQGFARIHKPVEERSDNWALLAHTR